MKVFIACSSRDYEVMFETLGYTIVSDPNEADFFCFTGGSDVNPELYGAPCDPRTSFNRARDNDDIRYFKMLGDRPAVGICRGAQFLNVMNGGGMIQHIPRQPYKHYVQDLLENKEWLCTSTHHQEMVVGDGGRIIGVYLDEENAEEYYDEEEDAYEREEPEEHTEVIVYEKALCFQPHPEQGERRCLQYFGELLDWFLTTE